MLAADQQASATRKLAQWLYNERRVVTYRDISREIQCHANVAKNVLRSYALNPSSPISTTYLLTGPLRSTAQLTKTALDTIDLSQPTATQMVRIVDMDEVSDAERNSEDGGDDDTPAGESVGGGVGSEGTRFGNDEGAEDGIAGGVGVGLDIKRESGEQEGIVGEQVTRWGCVLVQAEKLDEKKALFEDDKVCVTVYALSPAPIKDPAQYLVPNLALRNHERYRDPGVYGTITGTAFSVPGAEKKAMRDGGIDFSKGAVKVARGGSKAGTGAGKAAESSSLGKPETKVTKLPSPAPDAPKSVAQDKPLPPTKSKPIAKPKHSDSLTVDEAAAAVPTETLGVKSDPVIEPTSSMNRADDKAAMEAMMGMGMEDDVDMDAGDDVDIKQEPDVGAHSRASGSRAMAKGEAHNEQSKAGIKKEPGVRKKRKVKKSRTEVDEKGYMVTKDYYSEESYSGDSDPEVHHQSMAKKPTKGSRGKSGSAEPEAGRRKSGPSTTTIKPAPPPKKTTASSNGGAGAAGGGGMGKGRGGQMSLQGFFTKK